jgi:hypothetical protein
MMIQSGEVGRHLPHWNQPFMGISRSARSHHFTPTKKQMKDCVWLIHAAENQILYVSCTCIKMLRMFLVHLTKLYQLYSLK